MSTVMHRSFATAMGFDWPRDLAAIVDGKRVTFAEIRANKVAKQRQRLARILQCNGKRWRAAHVWVFYVPGWLYFGWHLYIRTINDSWWIRDDDKLALSIMAIYPCGVMPVRENFYIWKEKFAEAYARKGRRQQGMVAGWIHSEPGRRPERFYC